MCHAMKRRFFACQSSGAGLGHRLVGQDWDQIRFDRGEWRRLLYGLTGNLCRTVMVEDRDCRTRTSFWE